MTSCALVIMVSSTVGCPRGKPVLTQQLYGPRPRAINQQGSPAHLDSARVAGPGTRQWTERTITQGRPDTFRYLGLVIDPTAGTITCRYGAGDDVFTEAYSFDTAGDWASPGLAPAARLLYLLAGVSYYKTCAAATVDLGPDGATPAELALLREYYVQGLGEFAYKNGLDLSGLRFTGPVAAATPAPYGVRTGRPLIPFGGGLDSIVTVELLRPLSVDPALFVLNRRNDTFAAIESAIATSGLPVLRAERELDPLVLAPTSRTGYLNGHVPVTGVYSAAAVVAAVLDGRDAVVMSNEWSASSPTLIENGVAVNHQWSKSLEFETLFRAAVAETVGGLEYFSRLRSWSELRIARLFATLTPYHRTFRSCNRSFRLDPAQRLDHWCGECDKCCFVDLILAPFVDRATLGAIFGGREPLDRPDLLDRFRTLLGTSPDAKPFECVGDLEESIAAVQLAAADPARADQGTLHALAGELPANDDPVGHLLEPLGQDHVPAAYAG